MKFTRYPKRDAIRDYFPLPNEIFSLGLSTGEIAVYAYLMYCEDRKTFQCHPSYKTIGNAVGMSKNTVKKYVDSLIEKQLITAEPTSVYTQKGEKIIKGSEIQELRFTTGTNGIKQIIGMLEQAVKVSDDYEKLAGGINNIIVNQTVSK